MSQPRYAQKKHSSFKSSKLNKLCLLLIIALFPKLGLAEVPFTEHVISFTADGARSVYAVDVNDDGHMDVLSASPGDTKISWYNSKMSFKTIFLSCRFKCHFCTI